MRGFLLPFVLHFGLIFGLYAWLTVARNLAVRRGVAAMADFHRLGGDPPDIAPIARNLANQFELPTLAWFCASLLILADDVIAADIFAAWVFLAGRIIHTAVQTLTPNVGLRGQVFMINALAVIWLAGHVAALVVLGGF